MSSNSTRIAAHAAAGKTRLQKVNIEKPDTLVVLPDGKTLTLRRTHQDQMPIFRKLNPQKFDLPTGARKGSSKAKAKGRPHMVPFGRLILGAFLLAQAVQFARQHVLPWFTGRSKQLAAKPGQEAEQEGSDSEDYWEEEEDEQEAQTRTEVAREGAARVDLASALLRRVLPRPKRKGAAAQLADERRNRQRPHATAQQMMQPRGAKTRQPGMLERLDKAMRQQVAEVARQRLQHLKLEQGGQRQQLLPQGPGAPAPAAPAAALAPGSSSSSSNSQAGSAAVAVAAAAAAPARPVAPLVLSRTRAAAARAARPGAATAAGSASSSGSNAVGGSSS